MSGSSTSSIRWGHSGKCVNGWVGLGRITRTQRQRSDSSGGPGLFIATCRQRTSSKRDRSPGYSAEIAETICDRLVNGESLRAICADPGMPARATVFRWLASNQEFRRSYALARECQAEDFAYEILESSELLNHAIFAGR